MVNTSVFKMREGATYEAGGNYRRAFQSFGVARVADREKKYAQKFLREKNTWEFLPYHNLFFGKFSSNGSVKNAPQ